MHTATLAILRYICRELLLAGASAVQGELAASHVALWVFSESLAQVRAGQKLTLLFTSSFIGCNCCYRTWRLFLRKSMKVRHVVCRGAPWAAPLLTILVKIPWRLS